MKGWFTEFHTPYVGITIRIKQHLYDSHSKYQKIDVFDTPQFGRILILDKLIMITEKDEYIYHEMMTHVPLLTHKRPRKVLVIGGGDGGVIREICRHQEIEQIEQAEIDEEVIEVCKRFFPTVACGYDNPRVKVHITDGFAFVKNKESVYDVIIIDSTDPIGPGKILFSSQFYRYVYRALTADGIMTAQIGTPFYNPTHVKTTFNKLKKIFPIVRPYMAHIPTYTDGYYCLGLCSKKYDPLKNFAVKRYKSLEKSFKYYNQFIHKGAFLLPTYVSKLIYNTNKSKK